MAKYNVHIGSTVNNSSDPKFFIGTGFIGEGFNTRDELVALMRKYASFKRDGKSYWREEIKLSFELGETIEAFKAEGYRQCRENGYVDLFAAISVCNKDPFRGIEVIYRPTMWVDKDGNTFNYIIIKDNKIIPKFGKFSEILREIGIDI